MGEGGAITRPQRRAAAPLPSYISEPDMITVQKPDTTTLLHHGVPFS
jgi:hypothetical protein